jgi:Tfp pilus assembly protein PilN
MINLNLLPPQQKKEIELTNFNHLIVSLGVWLLSILIVFSLLLANAYFCLCIFLRTQNALIEEKQHDKENQHLTEMEESIKQANRQVNEVFTKGKELIVWTPLLEELAGMVPNGIYLKNFSFQTDTRRITISGWANTRDILLAFQESLEGSPCFTDIQSPLANLIKQENIYFSFNFLPIK